jgi:hypothetical protein
VLLSGSPGAPAPRHHGKPVTTSHTHHATPRSSHPATSRPHVKGLPPVAKAAAAFVGDLQAGVVSGKVTTQAGQALFNQLQQLLFQPPDRDPQQVQQQYDQLVQVYDQYTQRGDITGSSQTALSHALDALRTAIGAR